MFDFYRASLTPFLIRKQPGKINVTIGLYVNKKDAFVPRVILNVCCLCWLV